MMLEKDKPILGYILLFTLIIASWVFFAQLKGREVNFCRQAFAGLAKGRPSVEKMIDWPNFKVLDGDIGATYLQLSDDKERAVYRKNFIKNFSLGFKQSKSRLDLFTNWRMYYQDDEKTVVAADYLRHNKTILFSVSKGRKKLIAIQWSAQDD